MPHLIEHNKYYDVYTEHTHTLHHTRKEYIRYFSPLPLNSKYTVALALAHTSKHDSFILYIHARARPSDDDDI